MSLSLPPELDVAAGALLEPPVPDGLLAVLEPVELLPVGVELEDVRDSRTDLESRELP